ncbi:unnamed protein product [Phaedon cochleariae]|uniref:Endonuclease-reverse transcriptase n=1 Tax=Phaedon cochleariae TaxID=80249 RepID=A0A9P0GND5_PHACE|nr:unnamed protein product [Phaedon cochleariae]
MSEVSNDDVIAMFRELKQQNEEIKSQNNQLVHQFGELKVEFQNYKKEVEASIQGLQTDYEILKQENDVLKIKLNTTERKLKKFNLVIYGLKCGDDDISNDLIELFREKIGIECQERDFRDTYKISSTQENNKEPPILVEFVSNKLKTDILTNAKKLKGTGVYISVDYTSEDYKKKKFLISQQKLSRERGDTANIKGNTLVINGTTWTYEALLEKSHNNDADKEATSMNSCRKRGPEDSPEAIVNRTKRTVPKMPTRASSRICQ